MIKENLKNLYLNYIHDFSNPLIRKEDGFYFILILNGDLTISVNQLTTKIKTNDFISIQPEDQMRIIKNESAVGYIFSMSWEKLIDIIPNYDLIECNSARYANEHYQLLIKDYVKLVQAEHDTMSNSETLNLSYLYKFLHSLSLIINQKSSNAFPISQENKYLSRIRDIKKYVYINYMNPIKLTDLADHLYITSPYLSSFINIHMRTTFQKLLNETRVAKAAKELLDTKHSITKIAFSNGFSNIQSFNSSFKKIYQLAPNSYRKKHKIELGDIVNNPKNLSVEAEAIAKKSLSELIENLENDSNHIYTYDFEINANANDKPLSFSKRVWQEAINLSFATNLLSNNYQEHIKDVQSRLHFKYGRIQGILSSDIISKIPGSEIYNFSNFNRIIDFLYSVNLQPFLEFGNKPQKLNIKIDEYLFLTDKSYMKLSRDEWEKFLQSFLSNCINRYGLSEVTKWKFELWLPHSNNLSYTNVQIDEYIDYYEILYHCLKNRNPEIQLGGFGYNAAANKDVIKDVIKKIDSRGVKLNFFSFSSFHIVTSEAIPVLTSNEAYLEDKISEIQKAIHPYKIPLYLTEFTFDVTTRNYMHDSVFQALYLIRNVINNSDQLKMIAFWNLSDLSTEYSDINKILFGGNGIVSVDGIHKPIFYAYEFLSYLGNNIVDEGPNHIITSKGSGSYQIMILNYVHPSELSTYKYISNFKPNEVNTIFIDPKSKNYNITIDTASTGKYRVKSYILNKDHGSVIDEWCRIGVDNPLEGSELDYLKSICVPKQEIKYLEVTDKINLQGSIAPNEIIIYRIRMEL